MDTSIKIKVANCSDTGMERPHNEDSTITDTNINLVILADGMGGYEAGEMASSMAVVEVWHAVRESISQQNIVLSEFDEDEGYYQASLMIKEAVVHANTMIRNASKRYSHYRGMGTTIVVGLFHDKMLSIAHSGDSRLYRFRDSELQQLTSDHSLLQEMIDRGIYTAEEVHDNVPKNLVVAALGLDDDVDVDVTEEIVIVNDIYLLCSDGLTDMVEDEEICLILNENNDTINDKANNLVRVANQHGGKDNISVILTNVLNNDDSAKPWWRLV